MTPLSEQNYTSYQGIISKMMVRKVLNEIKMNEWFFTSMRTIFQISSTMKNKTHEIQNLLNK